MHRRQFITGALAGSTVLALGGMTWLGKNAYDAPLTIDFTLAQLDVFIQKSPAATGNWQLAKILHHCAQSVEYSLVGYPVHESQWFKRTVGAGALAVFTARRKMHHQLDAPIPGAPALPGNESVTLALSRLVSALHEFQQHEGPLKPHFAYGALNKEEYEVAHVLHINNHMEEVTFATNLA